jgi:glycosyltransferase involved in cell wall biosynthesis
MKVLWFSNTPASGEDFIGDKVIRGGWLKSLDIELKNKVDLHVAFNYPKYVKFFKCNGIQYYPICFKNWKLEILLNLFSIKISEKKRLKKYLEIIERVNPDLIHIHGSESTYIEMCKYIDVPIVLSIQGNNNGYVRKYTSTLSLKELSYKPYNLSKGIKWNLMLKNFRKEYLQILKYAIDERINLSSIKNIIGRTDWDRRLTSVLAPAATYYHNDEILRPLFYENCWKSPSNPKQNKLIIHTTGGVNTYKGIFTICEAVNELNILKYDFRWNIYGVNEDDQIIEIIKKKMGNNFPCANIYFKGSAGESELVSSLINSHLFVQSSHIENSPNSLCEAMILGIPCIATFAGGTSTLLTDKVEGIIIQDNDPFSMVGAILEMMNNYEHAIQYGEKARSKAQVRHNKEKIVSDLIGVYKKVI